MHFVAGAGRWEESRAARLANPQARLRVAMVSRWLWVGGGGGLMRVLGAACPGLASAFLFSLRSDSCSVGGQFAFL